VTVRATRETAPATLLLLAALGLCPAPGALHAQAIEGGDTLRATVARSAPSADAAPATEPVRVDGRLDEPIWQAAPLISGFLQREPLEGRPASERTEVRILYDHEALYIGAWLYDRDAAAILPGETRRDAELREGDAFTVVLDTYLDRQNAFLFATTPAGIEYDGQITREGQGGFTTGGVGQGRAQSGSGGGFNKNWDGSWQVATTRDAEGWYAEFRIPFSTLRYAGSGPQTWGLNLSRNIRRKNEESFWSPIPRQFDLYRVSLAGTLTALEAPAQRTLALTPYLLGSGNRDYQLGTGASWRGDVGGDAKIGITPSVTLDLTYNTDFAQVEVDEEQINLTRYRLFFPEKRPFFLENAGTFSVGTPQEVELFFSRRIGIQAGRPVPILGGGRLTGRAAGMTIGLLNIQTQGVDQYDASTGAFTPLAPANNYSVVRALRELPSRSRVGATFVSRLNTGDLDDRNLTYGVDGRLGIGEAISLDAYAAGTQTPRLEGPEYAYSLSGSYTTGTWRSGFAFREVSEDFNPEVGFLTRPGHRFFSGRLLRAYRVPGISWLREVRPHISARDLQDREWFTLTRLVHFDSHFEFSNGAFFQLPAINFTREGLKQPFEIARGVTVPVGTYDNVEWGFAYNTDLSARFSAQGRVDVGGFYSGRRAGTTSTLNARVGEKLLAGLRVSYYDVDLAEGSFQTSLVGLRAAYSFTPRIYLQSLIQYNDQTQNFSSNLRFGWLNTAGTGLFVVYNDSERAELFDRGLSGWQPLDRTLVVKFTRQFNMGL
jgi:hypothetical protein